MLATLRALRSMGGAGHLHDIDERVAEMEGVSSAELRILVPNGSAAKLKYYLAWARTYLKRGGALDNPRRSFWRLSETSDCVQTLDACRRIYDAVNAEEAEKVKRRREGKPVHA